MKLKTALVLAASVAGLTSFTQAAGIVGQQVLGVTYDYTDIDELDDSTDGASVFYNHPLATSWDLTARYGHQRGNLLGWDVRSNEYEIGVTYYHAADYGKAFIRPLVGVIDWKTGPSKDDSFFYGGEAGYEFPIGDRATVTPFVSYTDSSDFDGEFFYGVRADVDLSAKFGIFGQAKRNSDEDTVLSVGGLLRF